MSTRGRHDSSGYGTKRWRQRIARPAGCHGQSINFMDKHDGENPQTLRRRKEPLDYLSGRIDMKALLAWFRKEPS